MMTGLTMPNGLRDRRLLAALAIPVMLLLLPGAANARHNSHQPYQYQVVAKAKPDECFNGIGQPYPAGPPCAQGQPKVNQAYVWGLTQVHNKVWFGTGANIECLVSGFSLNLINPVQNDDFVCEFGQSQLAQSDPDVPPGLGDQRAPEMYYYDKANHHLVNQSAQIDARSPTDAQRRTQTIGIRAAGSFNGVVLFGGPNANPKGGVNLFAFDGDSGHYLGSLESDTWGNVRHFLVADGALYVGMGIGPNGQAGGQVLKWTGSKTNPFSFLDVGDLDGQPADLTVYDGRIFVDSWPRIPPTKVTDFPGVWMSPLLQKPGSAPGLTASDAAGWTQVWADTQYEPDLLVAATYGMGGLASYGGYLYFGTMHVPSQATKVFQAKYPSTDPTFLAAGVAGTQRASAIFRGSGFGTPQQKVDLLYGAPKLPKFIPDGNGGGSWTGASTNYTPLYGTSGFGNPWNNYEWAMTVAAGKLFVGTMDWSLLANDYLPAGSGVTVDPSKFGGDLWVFDSADAPATAVSTTGVGNYLSYGVRNMITDGNTVWLGMANPMNLRTDPTDDVPQGGWELIKMNAN